MLNIFAARYLKRMLDRHGLIQGTPYRGLLIMAELPRTLDVGEQAMLTNAARWGENVDNDPIALGFRALSSNYTRDYLRRASEVCVNRAASKGEDYKLREIRNQQRELMEVIWR